MPSAFLIGAPHSGAGKTTVTLGIMAALKKRGLAVRGFKVGPDYIDPSHHARLLGFPSQNLDTWMLSPEANRRIFASSLAGADVGVVEGVMGLYDGVDGVRPDGSSADLARQLDLPVVLVVDARSMARSAAALVLGFARFEPALRLAGVIWNRVGSASHRRILDEALAAAALPASLGAVPREASLSLPERHLGLVTPEDAGLEEGFFDSLAGMAEEHLDLEALLRLTAVPAPAAPAPPARSRPKSRIAVPRDAAFCFYYDENLRTLEALGAELVPFRPVEGDGVPPAVDALYLGGGYPEVHAERLAGNEAFLAGVRALHAEGKPLYGECGGFMVLCRALEDLEGRSYPMAGIFPAEAKMNGRAFRLGYREIRAEGHRLLAGTVARGHEFHYSHITEMPPDIPRVYEVRNARGEDLPREGYAQGSALGSYVHLHFASNPEFPRRLFGL
ncbi:MAG: cobyrinate a,c-diamide synthase [Deltaproteobacteria bacterium]|nr:cobyrinate a,c-diamide synthase [Deltaproteobacteria bacterium]